MPGEDSDCTPEAAGTENSVSTSGSIHAVVQAGSVSGDVHIYASASTPRAVVPRELPLDVLGFSGREAQLAELERIQTLASDQVVAVVISAIDGMAGVGKTALAVHFAHRLVDQYPDGQLFVDLHGYTPNVPPVEPMTGLERMLRSLGVHGERIPETLEERSALLRTRLADKRVLVVLDNAATDTQVRPLLPGTPGCLVLVTSRIRLTGLDDAIPLSLDVLPVNDAVALFTQAVGERRLANAGLTEEIIELCGRLPLAIRIAAARLRHRPTWAPRHLFELLRDEEGRLGELHAGRLSVATALGVSYAQLTDEQQRVFRLLSLHPGPDMDPYATAALTGTTASKARQLLEQLLDAHLLVQHAPGRFTFHDLVRTYITKHAHTSDAESDRQNALTRLFDYYGYTATVAMDTVYPYDADQRPHAPAPDTLAPDFREPSAAVAWLDTELHNLLATARTADHHSPDHTIHLSATLRRHLRTRVRCADAQYLHHHAYTLASTVGDHTGEVSALNGIGEVHWLQGRYEEAIACHERALEIAREAADRNGELMALIGLAHVHVMRGQDKQLAACVDEAMMIARDVGDRFGEIIALIGFGYVHQMRGQYEQAVGYFGRALEKSQEIDSRHGELTALNGLAEVHLMWGRDEQGVDCLERALVIAGSLGDRHGEVDALTGFGYGHYMRGRYEQAVSYLERALEIAQDTGDCHGERTALIGLGFIYLKRNRYEQAVGYLERALEIAQDTGNLRKEGVALTGFGYVHLMRGRYERAVNCLEQALEIAQDVACRDSQFEAHHGLGRVYFATGNHDQAVVHHRVALDLAIKLDQPADQARAYDGLAHAHHAIGQLEPARRHWQTALSILTARGWDRTEDPQVTVAALRAHLAEHQSHTRDRRVGTHRHDTPRADREQSESVTDDGSRDGS